MTSRRSMLAGLGAAAVGFSLSGGAEAAGKTLRFLNLDYYIGENTVADFLRESGVQVDIQVMQYNDEVWERLSQGQVRFDVVLASDSNLSRLIPAGLLQPLDHSLIPNFANIAERFRSPSYDPGCRYAVPYTWMVNGIGYRKSAVKAARTPDSWGWLFDRNIFDGRVAVFGDAVPLFMTAAQYLGYGVNGLTPPVISEIENLLKRRKPFVVHQDDGQDLLADGKVDLVMEYNGDIAMATDADIGFAMPREGGLLAVDNWAIPANAADPVAAHRFLNFMLSVKGGTDIVQTFVYPTPNAAVQSAMPAVYGKNAAFFPPLDNSATAAHLSEEVSSLVEAAWIRIRREA